jgi:hypothetical protein
MPAEINDLNRALYDDFMSLIDQRIISEVIFKHYIIHSLSSDMVIAKRKFNVEGFKSPPYLFIPHGYATQNLHPIS